MTTPALLESVVHEYNILYSPRIHQKDKKWCDGILRYYEFNSKIEILNEDEIVVATDFFQNKNSSQVLSTKLVDSTQFKLSTNKLIIEIMDKICTYTRDVTNSFKRKTRLSPMSIKYEEEGPTIKREEENTFIKQEILPLTPIRGSTLNLQSSSRKNLGVSGTPNVRGSENFRRVERSSVDHSKISKPKFRPIGLKKLKTNDSKNPTVIKQEPLSPESTTIPCDEGLEPPEYCSRIPMVVEPSMERSCYTSPSHCMKRGPSDQSHVPRIPPGSSSHFKYLNYDFKNEKPLDCKLKLVANPKPFFKVEHATEPFNVVKDLQSADIIYELSDFEEDQKFLEMLKAMREEKNESGGYESDKPSTPIKLHDGLITPNTSRKYNESHEFDLSTQSDFDDVDLN